MLETLILANIVCLLDRSRGCPVPGPAVGTIRFESPSFGESVTNDNLVWFESAVVEEVSKGYTHLLALMDR